MSLTEPPAGWSALAAETVERMALPSAPPLDFAARAGELLRLVASWAPRVNLTSAESAEALADLYLADALVLAAHAASARSWLDVGSGGGAPGLALALALPRTSGEDHGEFTLVEPRQKRVAFLRTAVGALGLEETVTVRRARLEELPPRTWHAAVARATFAPEEWLDRASRLGARDVWVLLSTTAPPVHEAFTLEAEVAYCWPHRNAARRALRYRRREPDRRA